MICASIKEKSLSKVLKKLKDLPKHYNLVEIWVNEIKDFDIDEILKGASNKLIFKITDPSNNKLIEESLKKDVSYIDIDIDADCIKLILEKKKKTKLIVSYHNFKETPPLKDLLDIALKIKKMGADIAKIVPTAKDLRDNITIFELLIQRKNIKLPMISFCMGEIGKMSRAYAEMFGSKINFIAPDENWITAPGQLTLKEWRIFKKE